MKRALLIVSLLAAVLLASLAAWRILIAGTASPALSTDADPVAQDGVRDAVSMRQEEVRQALAAKHWDVAADRARALLHDEPLTAEALVVLARVADARHRTDAGRLFELALARAPRDQYARAWVIGTQLQRGSYDAAMANIDTLLRMAPPRREILLPVMASYSDQPGFAAALVERLGEHPPWRSEALDYVLANASYAAIEAVYGGLQAAHDLPAGEAAAWYDRLGQAGLWGEAYSRWVADQPRSPGAPLPLLNDGDFEAPPVGDGFGWRIEGSPGVLIDRVAGTHGQAAQVTFLGRRATDIRFSQILLLAPGHYRLQFRASARDLRSDRGIVWELRCEGESPWRAASEPVRGSFDWQVYSLEFEVPEQGCPAQRLALTNPGADGAGKIVSGTLWFDDFRIVSVASAPLTAARTPAATGG